MNSEVKRLMITLKEVKEERNKFRDVCLKAISTAQLLTEIQAAYEEGHTTGCETAGRWSDDWQDSLSFAGFLAEHSGSPD